MGAAEVFRRFTEVIDRNDISGSASPLNSSTMTKRKIHLWMKLAIAVSLVLALPLGMFYPSLVPRVWHLRYPNGVRYGGRDILVPPEWIADENGLTVRLTKYPTSVFEEMPQGRILLTPSPREKFVEEAKKIDQLWEAKFRTQHAAEGEVIQGPVKYESEGKESVCMESYAKKNPAKISATCRLFQGEWLMEFMGDPKDLDFFLENFHHMNQK
jgi:hypothetical protein